MLSKSITLVYRRYSVSKMQKKWDPFEREEGEKRLKKKLSKGEITVGQALREVRQRSLGLTLEEYARFVQLSKTTLLNIERDAPSVQLGSIEKALRPLHFRLTLVSTLDDAD